MVKSVFYFTYIGNKYNEYDNIKDYISLDGIKTYVEPFSGSCSIGYILKKNNPKLQIHYNDIDVNLYNFLDYIRNANADELNQLKDRYTELTNMINTKEDWNNKIIPNIDSDILSYYYFMKNKMIGIMPRFINGNMSKGKHTLDIDYNNFIKSVNKFTNLDYIKILDEYKNDKKAFIFLDPPYLGTTSVYKNKESQTFDLSRGGLLSDLENHPLMILKKYLDTSKCKIMLIVDCSLTNYLIFKDYIKHNYKKKYDSNKKIVDHLIICNY